MQARKPVSTRCSALAALVLLQIGCGTESGSTPVNQGGGAGNAGSGAVSSGGTSGSSGALGGGGTGGTAGSGGAGGSSGSGATGGASTAGVGGSGGGPSLGASVIVHLVPADGVSGAQRVNFA